MVLPFDQAGSGPAVVLLHAGLADRTMWTEHLPSIAEAGYRAIALDLPGFGEAVPEAELAPWLDVVETLDALEVGSAALVGNSFGGAVALNVAVSAPKRVAALVLVCAPPPGLQPSPALEARWEAEGEALQRGDIDAAVDAVVDAWTRPDGPPGLRERIAAMQRRALELQLAPEQEPVEAREPVESDPDALGRLTVPALVCAAELDLPDFAAGAQRLAAQLPGARHVVLDGVGHLVPLEQPDRFVELVLEFLTEVFPPAR